MAPLGLVLFIGTLGMLEGKSTDEIKAKYQEVRIPYVIIPTENDRLVFLFGFSSASFFLGPNRCMFQRSWQTGRFGL